MIYRRKEDEMIHINLVGIGLFGQNAIKEFQIDNQRYFNPSIDGVVRMIVNENEVSSICNIIYENKIADDKDNLIPWDDEEIEAEGRTRSLLVLIGEADDASFKMFQMAAVSLLGNPDCKRIAFLHGQDANFSNGLICQQIDHVFECGSARETADTIRIFLESIYYRKYDMCTSEWIDMRHLFGKRDYIKMAYKSSVTRVRDGDKNNIAGLVQRTTETLISRINPFKKYFAYIVVEGCLSLGSLNEVMESFRNKMGKIQIVDEKLSVAVHLDERIHNCMISLYEVQEE